MLKKRGLSVHTGQMMYYIMGLIFSLFIIFYLYLTQQGPGVTN